VRRKILDNKNERKDSPFEMIAAYQELVSRLIEMSDQLKREEAYDLDKIFSIIWPQLNFIIPELSGGTLFGLLDDQFQCYAQRKNDPAFLEWEELSPKCLKETQIILNTDKENDFLIWNFDPGVPFFLSQDSMEQALCISWLCEHPHEENLYLLLVRNDMKRPFLSHECEAIKLISRIIGWVANYAMSYQSLMYKLNKDFVQKIHEADSAM
jgi:hypothetical protein